ncbi:MAG: 50S ribosomal protein L3 N(5)-glutamine methyltransferase [Glaciecola sp.]
MSIPLSTLPSEYESSLNELSTLLDWVRYCASRMNEADLFFGHGTDNAWDEAMVLVLFCVSLPPDIAQKTSDALFQAKVTQAEKQHIFALLHARVTTAEPLPYLTQQAWFAGYPFYVDHRVLIPRSPFAELIDDAFGQWLTQPPQLIMDLCTGGGCIAIALAHAFPFAQVDALDISEDALDVARINIAEHGLAERVFPVSSDVFSGVLGQQYDLIVSNPPYVDAEDMSDLPQEFLHEPALALAAGQDGLDIVETILRDASKHLTEQGWLFVEVGNSSVHMEQRFPGLNVQWIEFNHGGQGVFVVNRQTLVDYWQAQKVK